MSLTNRHSSGGRPKISGGGSTPTYYSSQAGGGNGLSPATPFRNIDFWNVATPNSRLLITDGTYTGTNSMIQPPANINGLSNGPITIGALNPGNVTIDGQGASNPVVLSGNKFIIVQDLNGKNSGSGASGVFTLTNGAQNCIIRRNCGWDAPIAFNVFIFSITGTNTNNNLIEDNGGWGTCRKPFDCSQSPQNNVYRRNVGRWEGSTCVGPKCVFEAVYNAGPTIYDNGIALISGEQQPASYRLQNDGVDLIYRTSADTKTIQGSGSISFNLNSSGSVFQINQRVRAFQHLTPANFMEGVVTANAGNTVTFTVDLSGGSGSLTPWDFYAQFINHGVDQMIAMVGDANGQTLAATFNGIIAILQAGDSVWPLQGGMFYSSGSTNETFKDNVAFIDPTQPTQNINTFALDATVGGNSCVNASSFKSTSGMNINAAAWGSTNQIDTSLAPTPGNYYPIGMKMYTADSSHGAAIRNRYVNGSLTSDLLFPWPMSARIKAASIASGHSTIDIDTLIQGIFGTYV